MKKAILILIFFNAFVIQSKIGSISISGNNGTSILSSGIFYADSLSDNIIERVFVFYTDGSFVFIPNNKYNEKYKINEDTSTSWNEFYFKTNYNLKSRDLTDKKDKTKWGKYQINDSLIIARVRCTSQDGMGANLVGEIRFKIINDSTIDLIQGLCSTLECSYVIDNENKWQVGKLFPDPPIRYRFHSFEKPDSSNAWFKYTQNKTRL